MGDDLLPFTAHRITLGDGRSTTDAGVDTLGALSTAALRIALGSFDGKRILDLGSLEGGFTIAFAQLGAAEAIGVEARQLNLRRANWARDELGLKNVSFRQGDVTQLGALDLGSFDAVFASGIVYHVPDPFRLIEDVFAITEDVALLDTRVAHPEINYDDSGPLVTRDHRGQPYEGRTFTEFPEPPDRATMEHELWASWGNVESFWLTEWSLVVLLRAVGFAYLHKVIVPDEYMDLPPDTRVVYVAKKRI